VLQRARELLPEHRQELKNFPVTLSQPEPLGQLLQSLDEALVHPTEDELGELFRELSPEALGTVLTWLPRLTTERVRDLLGGAARRLAQANPDQLVAALDTEEEAVLLETVRLAGELRLPPLVPGLGRLLETPKTDLKKRVVHSLASIGTPGAMKQLETAIDDDDRDVRIGAVRAMSERGYRGAFPKIEAAIKGKTSRDTDLTEKTVFFEAFGQLAGPAGIAMLQPMIQTKGFMRRKEDPQTRACAAMALGKIATPEARTILEGLASDKEPLVRNAVNKALREMG
jgi:HEAT repeat protein